MDNKIDTEEKGLWDPSLDFKEDAKEIEMKEYGSFDRRDPHSDSKENIAGFLKHEYRRRIRSPLDAGVTAFLFLSLLAALVVGVMRPLLHKDSPLSRPLSQILAYKGES
mmetsp:Transcript_11850/g.17658  ORF Transcript_11850/g.17658 Transcript_11850/m.17658 type:complete len:109 (+) Transcript_11850:83-409(+)